MEEKKVALPTDPELDSIILGLQKNINLTQGMIAQAQQNIEVISEMCKQVILRNEQIKKNYANIIEELQKPQKSNKISV